MSDLSHESHDFSVNENEYVFNQDPPEIPSEMVSPDFRMDPDTERLLWSSQLTPGMVVLLENDPLRAISDVDNPNNRWCRVSNFTTNAEGHVRFIGIYADGTQRSHRSTYADAWYVKKGSEL